MNARIFTEAGAALLLKEAEATSETLASTVLGMIENPETLAVMGARAHQLSPADAASLVVDTIVKRCQP